MSIYTKIRKERARTEIYGILAENMRISVSEMDVILVKHGIKRDPEALQRAYRLSVGQQLVADVRDQDGKREILASRAGGETSYIVLEGCNDPERLNEIQHRLNAQVEGLVGTLTKVDARTGTLKRLGNVLRLPLPHLPSSLCKQRRRR